MLRVPWTPAAWEHTIYWQGQDHKQLRRINQLIQACLHDAFVEIDKPEPLRENLSGCWSRRIDDEPCSPHATGPQKPPLSPGGRGCSRCAFLICKASPAASRVLEGQCSVPDDFDRLGSEAIADLFEGA
jgi:toxin YoeB